MNPMIQQFLVTVFRWLLAFIAGWLVKLGVFKSLGETEQYVAAAAVGLAVLCWSLWATYKKRLNFLAALTAPPGTTEAEVKEAVKSGDVKIAVSTPVDVVPEIKPVPDKK